MAFSIFWSMTILQRPPNVFIAQIVKQPQATHMTPRPVNSHPSPMAAISGSATIVATQESTLRTKLLSAMP